MIERWPSDLVTDRRFTTRRETLFNSQSHREFSAITKEMRPPGLPIAISAWDLGAWSQRWGTCGEVVEGPCGKGAKPYNMVGKWVFTFFNGF